MRGNHPSLDPSFSADWLDLWDWWENESPVEPRRVNLWKISQFQEQNKTSRSFNNKTQHKSNNYNNNNNKNKQIPSLYTDQSSWVCGGCLRNLATSVNYIINRPINVWRVLRGKNYERFEIIDLWTDPTKNYNFQCFSQKLRTNKQTTQQTNNNKTIYI